MTTKAEREHMARVASLPCACCGQYGVQVHHIRDGQGMSQRASNWLTVPLCEGCHTGQYGVHGDKSRMRARKQSELDHDPAAAERFNRLIRGPYMKWRASKGLA